MPAPIAPLVGFVLGVAFAWTAAEELARGTGITGRSLTVVSTFSLLVFAPISGYFLAFAPDWSYVYLIDSQRLPGAVDLGLVLLDAASVPVGFAAAARHARNKKGGAILRLGGFPLGVALLGLLLALPRLGVHATYSQYHGDFGVRSVSGSPLGYALLWMTLVLVGGTGFTLSWLRRTSRAARRG